MHRFAIILSLLLMSVGYAGPNQNARLYLDFEPKTPAVDSVGGCLKDSVITAAVRIEGASKLYGYQLYVKHDTASLRFVSGKSGSDQIAPMLERNGGSISFFSAKRSIYDSTRITIGASLLDNDAGQCVSDSGILCLLSFRHLKSDTTKIAIDSMLFLDCDEKPDTGLKCFSGTIVPSIDVAVNRPPAKRNGGMPKVAVRRGTLDIDFGVPTNYVLVAVNTLGKRVGMSKGTATRLSYQGCDVASANRSTGLTVVRVCWQGNEMTVPVLR